MVWIEWNMVSSYYLDKPVTKGHLSCRDTLVWIQRCSSSQVLLYFHPILTCVFMQVLCSCLHTVHFHTFSHWLTTWRGNSTSTYKSLFTCNNILWPYILYLLACLHHIWQVIATIIPVPCRYCITRSVVFANQHTQQLICLFPWDKVEVKLIAI